MCSFFFRDGRKTFGLQAKHFRPCCENCFWCVHNIIMRIFLEKTSDTFQHSRTLSKPFSAFSWKFRAGLLENTKLFFNHFRTLSETFSFLDQKNAIRLRKRHSTCLQEQFERINFLKKSLNFLKSFSETKPTKILAFSQFFSIGVDKSVFYASIGTFRQKIFFKKLYLCFQFFRNSTGKRFGLPASFIGQVLRKLQFTFL